MLMLIFSGICVYRESEFSFFFFSFLSQWIKFILVFQLRLYGRWISLLKLKIIRNLVFRSEVHLISCLNLVHIKFFFKDTGIWESF